ncbi:hypothetical protein V8E51_016592 [Hyaloscypha variabilis]
MATSRETNNVKSLQSMALWFLWSFVAMLFPSRAPMTALSQPPTSQLLPPVEASQPFAPPPESIHTLLLSHHLQHEPLSI